MRLLISAPLCQIDECLSVLRDLGHDLVLATDERGPLPAGAYKAEGIICNALLLHHEPSDFPELRFVQLTSAGLDRVPLGELSTRGVALFNAAGVYSVPMAEWVVMQILQIYKKARTFSRNQGLHRWDKARDLRELTGRTACIIGFGSVGREVATRLRAFDVNVIGVARQSMQSPLAKTIVGVQSLATVLPEADFIVLTLPIKQDTYHLVDAAAIALMKEDAVLVNVSRGAVLDETALLESLEHGKFLGVALDVFENEPLDESSRWWSQERAIITPHNSFVSDQAQGRLLELIVKNLSAVAAQQSD